MKVDGVGVHAFTIPVDGPDGIEQDGTLEWNSTTIALWDMRARLLELPLFRALPAYHDRVPVYGSGGFTNYPIDRLAGQLAGWVAQGIDQVKLKTSRDPGRDPHRLAAARDAIGDGTALLADANGALDRKQALYWAHRLAGGALRPNPERPGLGLAVRWGDLEPYRVHGSRPRIG